MLKKLFFKDLFGILGTVVELQHPPGFFLKESGNLSEEFFVSSIFRVKGSDPKCKGRGSSKTPWVEAEPKNLGKNQTQEELGVVFFK